MEVAVRAPIIPELQQCPDATVTGVDSAVRLAPIPEFTTTRRCLSISFPLIHVPHFPLHT